MHSLPNAEEAQVWPAAKAVADSKRTADSLPVQSVQTQLGHSGALRLNHIPLVQDDQLVFPLVTQPTALQGKAVALLGVDLDKVVSGKMAS